MIKITGGSFKPKSKKNNRKSNNKRQVKREALNEL